jgi:hypothetical protein
VAPISGQTDPVTEWTEHPTLSEQSDPAEVSTEELLARLALLMAESKTKPVPTHSVQPLQAVTVSPVTTGEEPQTEDAAEPITAPAGHSVKPVTEPPVEPDKRPGRRSVKPKLSTQSKAKLSTQSNRQVIDFEAHRRKLSTQSGVKYDRNQWKRSAKKPGWLIRRIEGYNISEDEYGVSYLFVLERNPDRVTADWMIGPFAGFFNWQALEDSGRLVPERTEKTDGRRKRATNG